MSSAFPWQNSISLCSASFCTKAKFACYSRYLLTSYICIPVPYDEKTSFFGVSSRKSCRSSQNHSSSISSALVVGAQTWITLVLNGLPSKQTEIILSFLRLHPSTAFQTLFFNYEGYFISSKGFLLTVVSRYNKFDTKSLFMLPSLL